MAPILTKSGAIKMFMFQAVLVQTKVVENPSLQSVRTLRTNGTYDHSVEIGKYYALWPLDLNLRSSLRDTKQLAFSESQSGNLHSAAWVWNITLHPNRSPGERTAVLQCGDIKVRDEEKIVVAVEGHDTTETIVLEVKIE